MPAGLRQQIRRFVLLVPWAHGLGNVESTKERLKMSEKLTVPLSRAQGERVVAAMRADRMMRSGYTSIGPFDDSQPIIKMTEFQECVRDLFEQLTPHKIEDVDGDVTFWLMPETESYWLEAALKSVTP